MSDERDPMQHYLNANLFLAYGWAYAFTVFAALVGLEATRFWPEFITWPLVILGFGSIVAVLIGMRPLLLDLVADLGIREKMGIAILFALAFLAPLLISNRATLVDCLIVLQVPMTMTLLQRDSFTRLHIVNFVLSALAIFVMWQTQQGGFAWALCVPVFLCGCFAADHFLFTLEKYPGVTDRPAVRPLLLAAKYAAVSLLGGGVLFALTPQLALAPQEEVDKMTGGGQAAPPSLSTDAILQLVWETFVMLVLLVGLLAVIQWLRRKYRHAEVEGETDLGAGMMKMVRKALRPRAPAPELTRGFSPREQILRGYWSWCAEMERFGLAREESMTPREYARAIVGREGSTSPPVQSMTELFEAAKYDKREISRAEAETFFNQTRSVVDIFIRTMQPEE